MPTHWNNLVEVACDRAASAPGDLACNFLSGTDKEDKLTLADLDLCARALAAAIQSKGLAGERTLLLMPPGLDFIIGFWACLYAKTVAVPTYPPDLKQLDRALSRLAGILRDSGAKAVLTTSQVKTTTNPVVEQTLGISDLVWLTPEDALAVGDWRPSAIARDDLALLQYTSGSTGHPKGVMISHGNILENTSIIAKAMKLSAGLQGVLWLPPYHDMGLIGGIIQPIISRIPIFLMAPVDFITRPLRWLTLISNRRLQATGGPNFAYDLCARKITAKQKANLDLSSWELAFTGAEPVRSTTLRSFAEEFAVCGFRSEAFFPCYGMAEATLFVSGGERGKQPTVCLVDRDGIGRGEVSAKNSLSSVEVVGLGQPGFGVEVRIVDPDSKRVTTPDRIGEVWVAGPSVGQGYWGRPQESEQTFRARPLGYEDGPPFLRTGDLGFVRNGELFIVGRMKDMIIVNGVKYHPEDIEAVADQSHETIRFGSTAAICIDGVAGDTLAIVAEAQTSQLSELNEAAVAIRSRVTAVNGIVPEIVVFIARHTMPKTPSGKVCRNATREALLAKALVLHSVFDWREGRRKVTGEDGGNQAARRQLQMALARLAPAARKQALTNLVIDAVMAVKPIPAQAAKLDVPVANFGLDSIHIVELLAELEERSGIILPMEKLVRGVTLGELVEIIYKEFS